MTKWLGFQLYKLGYWLASIGVNMNLNVTMAEWAIIHHKVKDDSKIIYGSYYDKNNLWFETNKSEEHTHEAIAINIKEIEVNEDKNDS